MTRRPTLLVFCHLRWNFVYQRPQHLLSRLCRDFDVLVIEEPLRGEDSPHLDSQRPCAGIEVLTPVTPLASWGFADDQMAVIAPLLQQALAHRQVTKPLVWFYTPMALPLLADIDSSGVVYDCMDELSAFKGAPQALQQREADLLALADVVFTGGPSLYEAKRARAARVLCLPSSVDAAHFAPRARERDVVDSGSPPVIDTDTVGPRLGFFGVIDERMDLALIDRLAAHDPNWHVVMVGPVVKIDPARLPQRPNLHWIGPQSYDQLPQWVASWQVCLLPFALNESTAFISPTKTLEYLAAGKPVVSTAVRDVGVLYGSGVEIAADADAFIAACAAALTETLPQREARLAAGAALVASGSWDRTADRVLQALQSLPQKTPRAATLDSADGQAMRLSQLATAGGLGNAAATLASKPAAAANAAQRNAAVDIPHAA